MAAHDCWPGGGRCHSHDKPLLFCEDSHQHSALRERVRVLGEALRPALDILVERQHVAHSEVCDCGLCMTVFHARAALTPTPEAS